MSALPRYYVARETIPGEPMVFWVVDRSRNAKVTEPTSDRNKAKRQQAVLMLSEPKPVRRRLFSETEVLEVLFRQGVDLQCYRCSKPLFHWMPQSDASLPWMMPVPVEKIQREHLSELALGGKDEPFNCVFSHESCHKRVTDGTPATTAGSSKQRIAKVKRIRGETKKKPSRKIPPRPFQKQKRAFR